MEIGYNYDYFDERSDKRVDDSGRKSDKESAERLKHFGIRTGELSLIFQTLYLIYRAFEEFF